MTTLTPLPDLTEVPRTPARAPARTRIAAYRRTPRDLFRAVVYLVITLAVLVPTILARSAILGFEQDLGGEHRGVLRTEHRCPIRPAERHG